MMNLFSMFDPLILNIPMNLMISLLILMNLMFKFYNNNQFMFKLIKFLINLIMNLNYKNNKSSSILFCPLMLILLMNNLMNLVPFINSQSSNIMLNLNLTLWIWFMNIIIVMKKSNILFSNMTPSNSPLSIISVINLIEFNSLLFQIISLTMRLTINMMLGHIIIHLVNMFFPTFLYMMVEMFIIFIQTYIFIMLNLLNFNNNM